jgi:hypothetical protein
MVRFYRNSDGNYIGAFEGATPAGGIEVPGAPKTAKDIWIDGEWVTPTTISALKTQKKRRD